MSALLLGFFSNAAFVPGTQKHRSGGLCYYPYNALISSHSGQPVLYLIGKLNNNQFMPNTDLILT